MLGYFDENEQKQMGKEQLSQLFYSQTLQAQYFGREEN